MFRKMMALVLCCSLCFGSVCSPTSTLPPDSILAVKEWSQLQGNKEGYGFNPVHTNHCLLPLRKWTAAVGELAYSSPVISLQNRVWLGTVAGDLVGIDGNSGAELFRSSSGGGTIVSTPAVDPDDRVFFISQHVGGNSFTSIVHVFDPVDGSQWPMNDQPAFRSTASPKIWHDYVFVPAVDDLLVFHRWTRELVVRKDCCTNLACGFFEPPEWFVIVACLGTLFTADLVFGIVDCTGFSGSSLPYFIGEPSVAIVDNPAVVPDADKPIVVMASPTNLTAFNFDPVSNSNKLAIRWQVDLVTIDCDSEVKSVRSTTPAVLINDQVVIGDERGRVRAFNVLDGASLWTYDGGSEIGAIKAPPVAALSQIYVVSEKYLIVLDSDGQFVTKYPLQGSGGGAAMSQDFVHVMTNQGIHSFGLSLNDSQSFEGSIIDPTHLGFTVPAIARDGTVYVAAPSGTLHAFGSGSLAFSLAAPSISWLSPVDGWSISYAAGQTFRLRLGQDADFDGDVLVSSEINGTLCEFHVQDAAEGACATTRPLDLGSHVLTAFATDSEGGQRAAEIRVEATNTPPTVEITSPQDNGVLYTGSPSSLIAQVSDNDETIPAGRIKWRSTRDGDLGEGASIDVTLTAGTHVISCTVIDELGEETIASVNVVVYSTH